MAVTPQMMWLRSLPSALLEEFGKVGGMGYGSLSMQAELNG